MSRLRIIGIGNPLMGDDGIGIAAVEQLRTMDLPEDVEVIDGGTGGMTLLTLIEGAQRVFFIDAVDMGKAPGSIACLGLDDLLSSSNDECLSLHASGALPALLLGRELNLLPPLALYGVQPALVAPGLGLSQVATASLTPLCSMLWLEIQTQH